MDVGRHTSQKPESSWRDSDSKISLDARLSAILEAIETERVPDRLLRLAEELQQELSLRKQRRSPN
jgi:hypothetical protein